MNLVFNEITIVDLANKEARRISFSDSLNLVTSNKNHRGKSVIMKSLYYTLGAEVYFPTPIINMSLLTMLDFSIGRRMYRVARMNRSFVVYEDGRLIEKYASVGAFGEKLSEIFDFDIDLVGKPSGGKEPQIVSCPPVFYYYPYYIDQENGWSSRSLSFDRMTMFDAPQRKNSYHFHLGIFDKSYVELQKQEKTNKEIIDSLRIENEKLSAVSDTLIEGIDAVDIAFDVVELESVIASRKDKLKELLNKVDKARKDLVAAEENQALLSHEKEVLAKYIKKNKVDESLNDVENIECPKCGFVFERSMAVKLEKTYLIESLHEDYVGLATDLQVAENSVQRLTRIFEERQKQLKAYEASVSREQDTYDTYLKSKTTRELLSDYKARIGKNSSEMASLTGAIADIRNQKNEYDVQLKNANAIYGDYLAKLFITLDVPKDQVEADSEIGDMLNPSGAYGPRCKIAQTLAFVQTKKDIAPDITDFPIVIDSPNVLEQDNEHLALVIETLFGWNATNNQIIISSIEGRQAAASIEGVKVINLTNPKNHLLDADEYGALQDEIDAVFLQF